MARKNKKVRYQSFNEGKATGTWGLGVGTSGLGVGTWRLGGGDLGDMRANRVEPGG